MPHSNCIQSGCQLSNLENLTGMELPKFPIGAIVSSRWVDETGELRRDVGTIVGLFPAPHDWRPGWWYVVRLDSVDGCEWLSLPYDDETHESDLELFRQS